MPSPLGIADRSAVAVHELAEGRALAVDLIRHDDAEARGGALQADRSAVERPMVEDAEGQAVGHFVGSAGCVPPDVRRVQSDEIVVQPDVEAAHGAASLVRSQDGMAETWIAR